MLETPKLMIGFLIRLTKVEANFSLDMNIRVISLAIMHVLFKW